MAVEIRLMQAGELSQTLKIVREVFGEFEAPEYSDEGIREFNDFITMENIAAMLEKNEIEIYVAVRDKRIVGMIGVKPHGHISLLFVQKNFHRQGIARALLNKALLHVTSAVITVNSSPYAMEAYRCLGFTPCGDEQVTNGIRFVPMHLNI